MTTQCNATKLTFHELDSREVVGRFDGGEITSDAGGVLLREVEKRTRILGRMSECFDDHRDPERIEHTVESLVKQRVMGLCLGYEDLNDHDELCRDRMMALLCESDELSSRRLNEWSLRDSRGGSVCWTWMTVKRAGAGEDLPPTMPVSTGLPPLV